MKVFNSEGIANHTDPESWLGRRESAGQALTGQGAGWVLSRETIFSGVPTAFLCSEGNTACVAIARRKWAPRGQRPHARIETFCTEPGRSHRCPHPVGVDRAENPKGVQPR